MLVNNVAKGEQRRGKENNVAGGFTENGRKDCQDLEGRQQHSEERKRGNNKKVEGTKRRKEGEGMEKVEQEKASRRVRKEE